MKTITFDNSTVKKITLTNFLAWKYCGNSAETVRFHKILKYGIR